MKYDMKQWLWELCKSPAQKPLPILSFPAVSLLGVSVRELIASAEMQARGMQLVAERTPAAASVSLMDLSVEAEAFGAEVRFSDDEVPNVIGQLVTSDEDAEALRVPAVGDGRTGICVDAIRLAKERINDRPVLAGIIGPFSLAARLCDVSEIMMTCYDAPDTVHAVLRKATDFLVSYAQAFKDAGADGILMAEPVAGLLSPTLEEEFAAPYVKEIVDAVQSREFAVIYHNCGDNTPMMVDSMLSVGAAAYHFGNAIDLSLMLEKFPSDVPVMGNVDPAGILRRGTPEAVREATRELLEKCSGFPNFVLSSGCDIPPMTPWENLDAFFAASEEFHAN